MNIGNPFRGKRWQTLVGYALAAFLLIVLLYGLVGYATGSVPYYVVSDRPSSMSPTIDFGGLVVTYRVPFATLKPGDIIVFHDPLVYPDIIVHRIVGTIPNCPNLGSECLVTKGDNNVTNPSPDPWNVTQQYYVGKVILIVPYLGYLVPSIWSSEGPLAYAPIVFVIMLIWAVSYIHSQRGKHLKSERTIDSDRTEASGRKSLS